MNHFRLAWTSAALCLAASCQAAPISDRPIAAIEPGLEIDDRLGGAIGWLDDRTLLVTAQIGPKSEFWERKVVRVDARTGEMSELFNPGALVCTNPVEKVAGVFIGSEAGNFTGSVPKPPPPVLKLFTWVSLLGRLIPKVSTTDWNPFMCKTTMPAHVQVPELAVANHWPIRYLDGRDSYLRFLNGIQGAYGSVTLVRDNREVAALQVKPVEIAPSPEYLPFRDEYLLAAGQFALGEVRFARPNEAPTSEYPLLTLSKSGAVKREYVRSLFVGIEAPGGSSLPYAKGTLVFVPYRPDEGGGVYLKEAESIKRVWCTNAGNTWDRKCNPVTISMSPDGCHLAFFAKGSDNLKAIAPDRPTLKILPLCV